MIAKIRNDGDVARLQYAQVRNEVKRLLRISKRTIKRGIARQTKTNPKAVWSHTFYYVTLFFHLYNDQPKIKYK